MKQIESKFEKTTEFLNAFLENDFENYLELQNFIEQHIEKNQTEIGQKYDNLEEIEDENDWKIAMDQFDKELGTDLYRFDHEFPNRTRFFLIIQTHSMLEVYIKWLCEKLRKINKNPIGINDLKGNSDLDKGKLYLNRIYQVDFSKLEPQWSFLNDMRKIRNQIIHNNGKFTINDKEILRIIDQTVDLSRMWEDIHPDLNVNEEYEIKINSKELNERYIESVKVFFRKLVDEIKKSGINTA